MGSWTILVVEYDRKRDAVHQNSRPFLSYSVWIKETLDPATCPPCVSLFWSFLKSNYSVANLISLRYDRNQWGGEQHSNPSLIWKKAKKWNAKGFKPYKQLNLKQPMYMPKRNYQVICRAVWHIASSCKSLSSLKNFLHIHLVTIHLFIFVSMCTFSFLRPIVYFINCITKIQHGTAKDCETGNC